MQQTMSFDEVGAYLHAFLEDRRDPLHAEITKLVPNFDVLMGIILRNMRYVTEHDGAPEQDTLLSGDVSRLCLLNMYLPFFTLSEAYEALPSFADAYVLLIRNYCQAYGVDGTLSQTLEAMEKLLTTKHTYTKL